VSAHLLSEASYACRVLKSQFLDLLLPLVLSPFDIGYMGLVSALGSVSLCMPSARTAEGSV
jgi:hypothetical protein